MSSSTRIALAACLEVVPVLPGQAPPARSKAKVEFRWLEPRPVKDVTEDKGIRTTCGDGLSYPHLKPILTNKDVAEARLRNHDFSASGLPGDHFTVSPHLTDEARKTLVAACGDSPGKVLAVFVDGKYWGTASFRKSDVAGFVPQAGFIPSRAEAERIVEACK